MRCGLPGNQRWSCIHDGRNCHHNSHCMDSILDRSHVSSVVFHLWHHCIHGRDSTCHSCRTFPGRCIFDHYRHHHHVYRGLCPCQCHLGLYHCRCLCRCNLGHFHLEAYQCCLLLSR